MRTKLTFISLPYLLVMAMAAGVSSFAASDVLYFRQSGLNLAQIGMMMFCYNIAVTLAELPFAVLFDKHSVKLTLYAGFIIRIAAFILFALNWGFSYFLAAQILAGIATAAGSGTATSLILNEVKEQNPQNMSAEKSRLTLLSGIGSLLGASLGIVLFQYFPPAIWWLACVFFIFALIFVYFFRDKQAESYGVPLKQLIRGWLEIFRLRPAWLLALCNACAIGPLMLWQLKFQHISAAFTIAGFYIITLASAAAARAFPALRLGPASLKYSIALNIVSVLCFAFAGGAWAVPAAFAFCVIVHVILSIQLEGLFHASVKNSVRASACSIISLADSALAAIFAPVIGLLADKFGVSAAIALSALLYLSLLIAAAAPARRAAQNA